MTKKRIISVFLVLTLVFAFMPLLPAQPVYAASPITSFPGKFNYESSTDRLATEGWKWDKANKILTLKGLNLCDSSTNNALEVPSGTTIEIYGTNTIKSTASNGIVTGTDLVIKGTGTLNIDAKKIGIEGNSFTGDEDGVTIQSGTLNIKSGSHGIYVYRAYITINGGTTYVTTPAETAVCAISSYIYIKGGALKINALDGVCSSFETKISGGNLDILVERYGITPSSYFGKTTITGGSGRVKTKGSGSSYFAVSGGDASSTSLLSVAINIPVKGWNEADKGYTLDTKIARIKPEKSAHWSLDTFVEKDTNKPVTNLTYGSFKEIPDISPPTVSMKVLSKPAALKLTKKKVSWKPVTGNNGYTLKVLKGKKVILTKQIKKDAKKYTFTKKDKKKFKKNVKYSVTLVAKGKAAVSKNSPAAASKRIKLK